MSIANESSLLEIIPESQLELHQVPRLKKENVVAHPAYKFTRNPTIEDLKEFCGLFTIWQRNDTVIVNRGGIGPIDQKLLFLDQ
jgi:hypothetical protein